MVNALLTAYQKGDSKSLIKLLEKDALASTSTGNIAHFEKAYTQLLPLYDTVKPRSKNANLIIALHLLIRLSDNEVSEFHSELESVPSATLQAPELIWVRNLEQGITEGNYQEVRKLIDAPPSKYFEKWTLNMSDQLRKDIAKCAEAAYESLPIVNLTTMLTLENLKAAEQFAGDYGWIVRDGRVYFPKRDTGVPGSNDVEMEEGDEETGETARERLITQTLGYARELESIV